MTIHFPITGPLGREADLIIQALNTRSEQIKTNIDSQNIVKKISMTALKTFGLASGMVSVACVPVAVIMFTAAPITLGAISLGTAITCLALCILLNPRSPGELIVKDYWKEIFFALREGNGKQIVEKCQELAKQKEARTTSFSNSLGTLSVEDTNSFFHKTCLVGYLQIAMDHLKKGEDEQAKSNAHLALAHFDASGFSTQIEKFIKTLADAPKKMRLFVETYPVGNDLHALDALMLHFPENGL